MYRSPAYAGIDQLRYSLVTQMAAFPRIRGDRPLVKRAPR